MVIRACGVRTLCDFCEKYGKYIDEPVPIMYNRFKLKQAMPGVASLQVLSFRMESENSDTQEVSKSAFSTWGRFLFAFLGLSRWNGGVQVGDTDRKPTTIFLADDDACVRRTLMDFFASCPYYRVIGQASDGAQAVEQCRDLRPDVALLDIQMPILDGIKAAQILLEEKSVKCVVMLTAFSDMGYIHQALDIGAFGYLTKPFEPEKILPTLEVCIHQSKEHNLLQKEYTNMSQRSMTGSVWIGPSCCRLWQMRSRRMYLLTAARPLGEQPSWCRRQSLRRCRLTTAAAFWGR